MHSRIQVLLENPRRGVGICLILLPLPAVLAIQDARAAGYLPGATLTPATVIGLRMEPRRNNPPLCYADVLIAEKPAKAYVDCYEANELSAGDSLTVVAKRGGFCSPVFARSDFLLYGSIVLGLMVALAFFGYGALVEHRSRPQHP
jgi:hypothetical protein